MKTSKNYFEVGSKDEIFINSTYPGLHSEVRENSTPSSESGGRNINRSLIYENNSEKGTEKKFAISTGELWFANAPLNLI